MDGAAKGNWDRRASIGVVLKNSNGEVLISFFKLIEIKGSNEVLGSLEALRIYFGLFSESLIVESDSINVILWVL